MRCSFSTDLGTHPLFQALHTPCRITYSGGERVPQHELLACAQYGCFAFSCFEDFAIRVKWQRREELDIAKCASLGVLRSGPNRGHTTMSLCVL